MRPYIFGLASGAALMFLFPGVIELLLLISFIGVVLIGASWAIRGNSSLTARDRKALSHVLGEGTSQRYPKGRL